MEDDLLEEHKNKMIELQSNGDIELAHSEADNLLCEFLIKLGYREIVEEYKKIEKWHA